CRMGGNGIENRTCWILCSQRGRVLEPPEKASTDCRMRHSAAPRVPGSWSQRVDARRQARQLARDRVLVKHPLGDRPMQLRLRGLKGGSRRLLVTAGDRRLNLFDKGANPAPPGAIDRRPL